VKWVIIAYTDRYGYSPGEVLMTPCSCEGGSTLLVLVLVLVLARLVLVGRLVWLLLVLVNFRPHYFS
jgi:hypothetical protein